MKLYESNLNKSIIHIYKMSEIHTVKSEYHKKYQTENKDKINERQRKRYISKKQKDDEEKCKIDKLLETIQGLNDKLEQNKIDKTQLNDIQYAITQLLSDKIVKDADEDNTHVNPEPIKRFIKSLEVASSSVTTTTEQSESEEESINNEEEESEFEIDDNGNII